MSEYAGYLKNVKTGSIIGVQRKSTLVEYERQNQQLKKRGDEHLIEWEVYEKEEQQKKPGRPAK